MPNIKKNNISIKFITTFLPILFFLNCKTDQPIYPIQKVATGEKAMVVAAHPLATQAGLEILEQGGNAVDAAVAVQFALAVVFPRAGNIGGGGFMVYRSAQGNTNTLDFREKAPGQAERDMYLDSLGNVIEGLSTSGHLAVGVPGVTAGMVEAHNKYGKLDWPVLLQPAIRLAEGHRLTEGEAQSYNRYQKEFRDWNTQPTVFLSDNPFVKGQMFKQADLAETLRRIAQNGKTGFYEGKTADLFVAEMKRSNGIINHEDLKNYNAVWRKPVVEEYKKGYEIISMPPPSSGGIALCQLLNITEEMGLEKYPFQSKEHVHIVTEAERRVYADRATHLGDSDFYPVPIDTLLSDTYNTIRISDFNPDAATSSDSVAAGVIVLPDESEETTHFSIVDGEGNAVSITTTINSNYGSKVVVGGAGFFLNNEMDDFSAKPGVPNQFGLIGNEANAIEPGKRMLSSMTPTIVTKDGKLFMVVGTPGGSTIITSVFQTIVNVIEYKQNLEQAVHGKRFHSQWRPDKIFIEKESLSPEVIGQLEAMGHVVETRSPIGRVDAILIEADGSMTGVGDNRGEDHAEGL